MAKYQVPDCRVHFRPIEPDWDDAYLVAKWRNQDDARKAFFSDLVVTPDTHIDFMINRGAHDLVWVVKHGDLIIGMTSLKVDVENYTGEYGRTYIDPDYRGQGYAEDTEFTLVHLGFEFLRLNELWLDALTDNVAILNLHKKLGWLEDGIDLEGHTDEKGSVQHMTYSRDRWAEMFPLLNSRAKERLCRSQ